MAAHWGGSVSQVAAETAETGTHMQRRDALLVRVCRIAGAAVKQLLDGANLAQAGQLHDVGLDGQAGLLVGHVVEFVCMLGVVAVGRGGGSSHVGEVRFRDGEEGGRKRAVVAGVAGRCGGCLHNEWDGDGAGDQVRIKIVVCMLRTDC
jgi:hypothetical protein